MKTFSIIKLSTKDWLFIVKNQSVTINMRLGYSSITKTYTGTMFESYVENIRALLQLEPNFLVEFKTFRPEESLIELGYKQVEPTAQEILAYSFKEVSL